MFTVSHFPYCQPHTSRQQAVGHSSLPTDSVSVSHLLAIQFTRPSQISGSAWSPVSLGKARKQWPCAARLQAPGARLHPHSGSSVLVGVCSVSRLHIFALLRRLLFEAVPGTAVTDAMCP